MVTWHSRCTAVFTGKRDMDEEQRQRVAIMHIESDRQIVSPANSQLSWNG